MKTNSPNPAPPAGPIRKGTQTGWLLCLLLLITPGVVSGGVMAMGLGPIAFLTSLGGSVAVGLVCGTWSAQQIGRTQGSRIALTVLMSLICFGAALAISLAGCAAGLVFVEGRGS